MCNLRFKNLLISQKKLLIKNITMFTRIGTVCLCAWLMATVVHSLPADIEDGGLAPPTDVPVTVNLPTSEQTTGSHANVVSLGLVHAFVASLSVIVVSELGDKTFFIAAIMAMRHSRITVFAGAISALALMTVLSGNEYIFIYFVFVFKQNRHKNCYWHNHIVYDSIAINYYDSEL